MYFVLLGEKLIVDENCIMFGVDMGSTEEWKKNCDCIDQNNSIISNQYRKDRRLSLLFRLKYVQQLRKCAVKMFKVNAIRDHLLQKTNNGVSKSSTSSSLAGDESESTEANQGYHSTDQVFRDTFVKLNFNSPHHRSCDDLLTTTKTKNDDTSSTTTKFNRRLRRKQNRRSDETIDCNPLLNNNYMTKDPAMSPINLIGIKTTNGQHFQEPHYEAIKDLSIKAAFRISSNNSTPEGSPKLFHNRKYVLNNDDKLAEKISPLLERKKKLSGKGVKNPPLPKRNTSSSTHHLADDGVTEVTANPIYGNTLTYVNSASEPCYTDVTFHNKKNSVTNSPQLTVKIDHPYSEIIPRPRRSANSSDNDTSPNMSPDRVMGSPFSSRRSFKLTANLIDGSKSDGDLSDSDILDIPRLYDRRRSRTGNGAELADPSRFYETPDQQKPRRVKQNYRGKTYEKDYVETIIKPRPNIKNSVQPTTTESTYENNVCLLMNQSTSSDDEPTYENPDLPRILTFETEAQPTYENNELLNDEAPSGYACIRQTSVSTSSDASDSNYNNICFSSRQDQLQYAHIDLHPQHPLYDNLTSSELDKDTANSIHSRLYSVTKNSKYTEIDFQKSDGLKEALNQLRAGESATTPELNAEYKIDLSHIKFSRSSESKRNSKNLE
uniref:Uncharacterized protein n=1 Tax=Clytia hemisphaerica TaxID=252671 RepID=A0A7M5UZI5_9CNID